MNPFKVWGKYPPNANDRFDFRIILKNGAVAEMINISATRCIEIWNYYIHEKLMAPVWGYDLRVHALKPDPRPEVPTLWERFKEKVSVRFDWCDVWVGVYYFKTYKFLYICPLPFCRIRIKL